MEHVTEQIQIQISLYMAVLNRAVLSHVRHGTMWAVVENGLYYVFKKKLILIRFIKKKRCFLRFKKYSIDPIHSQVYERYTFERLQLTTHLPDQNTLSVMPNTVNAALLPLTNGEFTFIDKEYEE